MSKKYYITFFGANATGKSSTAGWLSEQLPKHGITVATVGKYGIRKGRTYHTGGADALHSKVKGKSMTNQERFEEVETQWMSDADVVIGEGMMLSGHQELRFYTELKEKKDREILVIHLYASIDELGKRITERSGGRELTPIRIKRLEIRTKGSIQSLNKVKDLEDKLHIHEFDTTKSSDFPKFRGKILELLGAK